MSHLRLLCASAAVAIALALFGPFICAQYDQTVAMGGAPVNPYVQAVCGSSGLTVYESSGSFYP